MRKIGNRRKKRVRKAKKNERTFVFLWYKCVSANVLFVIVAYNPTNAENYKYYFQQPSNSPTLTFHSHFFDPSLIDEPGKVLAIKYNAPSQPAHLSMAYGRYRGRIN
jgi:hypothetical protein